MMPTTKQTVSVRLDHEAKLRVEQAAKLVGQSAGAFIEKAGVERAQQVLIDWAIKQQRRGDASFSELAEQTNLSIEQIMAAAGQRD